VPRYALLRTMRHGRMPIQTRCGWIGIGCKSAKHTAQVEAGGGGLYGGSRLTSWTLSRTAGSSKVRGPRSYSVANVDRASRGRDIQTHPRAKEENRGGCGDSIPEQKTGPRGNSGVAVRESNGQGREVTVEREGARRRGPATAGDHCCGATLPATRTAGGLTYGGGPR
jgi:hypothetical protein